MLLAVATGQRVQTLRAIHLDNLVSNEDSISINITTRMKQTKGDRPAPSLFIPKLDSDPNICVKRCINHYIICTTMYRKAQYLLVSHVYPHNWVSTTTLSRWLCTILSEAGVDSKVFSAHSTCSASSSKAALHIPMAKVMEVVDWRSETVFRQHYLRPISSRGDFAKSVFTK